MAGEVPQERANPRHEGAERLLGDGPGLALGPQAFETHEQHPVLALQALAGVGGVRPDRLDPIEEALCLLPPEVSPEEWNELPQGGGEACGLDRGGLGRSRGGESGLYLLQVAVELPVLLENPIRLKDELGGVGLSHGKSLSDLEARCSLVSLFQKYPPTGSLSL